MLVKAAMEYGQLPELSHGDGVRAAMGYGHPLSSMLVFSSTALFLFTIAMVLYIGGYFDQPHENSAVSGPAFFRILSNKIFMGNKRTPESTGPLPWHQAFCTNEPQRKDPSEGSPSWDAAKRACQDLLNKFLKSESQQIAPHTIDIATLRAATLQLVKSSMKPLSKGRMDFQVGSDCINLQKSFSAPLIPMLLFAEKKWSKFYHRKTMLLECAANMFEQSCSTASLKLYEAGWVSGKPHRGDNTGRSKDSPKSMVFGISMKKDTSSTSSKTGRCNGLVASSSSAETTLIPMVHELNHSELKHHNSDPHSSVDEDGIFKTDKAKAIATWVLATAAAHHATGNRDLLTDLRTVGDDLFVHAADGAAMQVLGCGNVISDALVLADVFYVPGLTKNVNLVSVSQLAELNYNVEFGRGKCNVRSDAADDDDGLVGAGHIGEGGVYELDFLKTRRLTV